MNVIINGLTVSTLDFIGDDNELKHNFRYENPVRLNFVPGTITIRLETTKGSRGPNLDHLRVFELRTGSFIGEGVDNDDRFILINGITNNPSFCDRMSGQAEDEDAPVFAIHPTLGILQWDPRLILEPNTLSNPLPDGGGITKLVTGEKTKCSNVERTIFNEEHCVMTQDPNVCKVDADTSSIEISLDRINLLNLFDLTGRYVYSIMGLKVKQTEFSYEVDHPCTPGFRSRWEKGTPICSNPTSLGTNTYSSLYKLLSTSSDTNPFVRDIVFTSSYVCDSFDTDVEIEIQVDSNCYTHVHNEHMSVWDLTYWTEPNTHPGNSVAEQAGKRHPIKKWLHDGKHNLWFPSNHPTDQTFDHSTNRWDVNTGKFEYIGRFGDSVPFIDLPNELRTELVADYYGASVPGSALTIVCGSAGEVANKPQLGSNFDLSTNLFRDATTVRDFGIQRESVWAMISLFASDQLRQRMAWVLSQILVIAKTAVGGYFSSTEMFLSYHDIFVRNAFGNYLDVLREISYSPLMAENLSYVASKSTAYVKKTKNRLEFADENFAREIMQLFTTGLDLLNMDGTLKLDAEGNAQQVYTNVEIRSFARVWTGFQRQNSRGNVEYYDDRNRIDPMKIEPQWRDRFPKSDLYGGFIGDKYPLCVDMPSRQFLRKGAKYRLLAGSARPELMTDNSKFTQRFTLSSTSSLFDVLCNDQGSAVCTFPQIVELDINLSCDSVECEVDTVRVVEVTSGVFYEYIAPPCVEHPFYDDAMKLNRATNLKDPIYGNPLLPVATSACCETPNSFTLAISDNRYEIERMTFATQEARCAALERQSCEYDHVDIDALSHEKDVVYHWAYAPCYILAKVNPDGDIAIVHNAIIPSNGQPFVQHVMADSLNYFHVNWEENLFPTAENGQCGSCTLLDGVNCLCETSLTTSTVFTNIPTSADDIISALNIGAPDPANFDTNYYGVAATGPGFKVYHVGGASGSYNVDTIFEVTDHNGRLLFLKNVMSNVSINDPNGSSFTFRNPVHFMSLIPSETNARDAMYETEATLQHYFYHDNTAPFLCIRFIQRFGISNPSPRYIEACSTAFKTGSYYSNGIDFGTGAYGDLAATVASIVLDREARSTSVRADVSYGSIREPLLKIISLMRSMEYSSFDDESPVVIFSDIHLMMGQMPYEYESVFSFFLPEYEPSGAISAASLVSPEAMMIDEPKVTGLLNGIQSMIKYGLSRCPGLGYGFSLPVNLGGCYDGFYNRASGALMYQPASGASTVQVIDDLSTLLTSGRLSWESRQIIVDVYENYKAQIDENAGLRMAMQLMTSTPEFHTTTTPILSGISRPDPVLPTPTGIPYKAVVFLFLSGGCDSFNMLVPKTCSSTASRPVDAYTHYVDSRNPVHLLQENLLPIDSSGQVDCTEFGLHEELTSLQQLYNSDELLFFANTGVLGSASDKTNYMENTPTQLFAHNFMQDETKRVDLFDEVAGSGVLGRLADVLTANNVATGSSSLDGTSIILASLSDESPPPVVVSGSGMKQFVYQSDSRDEIITNIKRLNQATTMDSNFMAETWSANLHQSIAQNEVLYNSMMSSSITSKFGDRTLGQKFELIAKMIETREERGTDLDIFHVSMNGYDTHANVESVLTEKFGEMNSAIASFVENMKSIGRWNDVTVVQASEFGRTITPNTGAGTDHGWGGNVFMFGGNVNGGKILGSYPDDLTDNSPIGIGRGRLIPTTSWDQIWPAIASHHGVTEDSDLDIICPNRKKFANAFSQSDLFK